jgi:ureidoglycolate hydrolase
MTVLPLAPITAGAFAPYGWLAADDDAGGRPINDGTSRRVEGAELAEPVTLEWGG